MAFWVYILRCADGSYYTGHTDDLDTRISGHEPGEVRGYTFTRRPVVLASAEEFPSRIEALERERQIKGWFRRKKEALIQRDWDSLRRLAKTRGSTGSPRTELSRGRRDAGWTMAKLPASNATDILKVRRTWASEGVPS